MSTFIWKNLRYPKLDPSSTSLHAYERHKAQPQGLIPNVPIKLAQKNILINIEVGNAQNNILLGHSYMYTIKFISSIVFQTIIFPHDDKIVKIG